MDGIRRFTDQLKHATRHAISNAARREPTSRERLLTLIREKFGEAPFFLVSHQEPYMHVYRGDEIECTRYASGLTVALDSIAQAFQGVWIAHGGGEADRETADEAGRVRVPPQHPAYTLKRLFLTKPQIDGFYYGFANRVLWPLCHIAYVRPQFDVESWERYREVNELFADAVLEEIGDRHALVFLQDYHLALCAQYIKAKNPRVTTVLFWHIPWPNPEVFRICPWKREILDGMLANDLMGFHLPYHRENFLETVALELESKIDREQLAVIRRGHTTSIRAYPIGVDFEDIAALAADSSLPDRLEALNRRYRLRGVRVAVGVDRLDYTKGIPERLQALRRLFDKYPAYRRQLVYVQIGVPTRIHLREYQDAMDAIEKQIDEINWQYGDRAWTPILFLKGGMDFKELVPFYRRADLCIVSSLHDGMNLVAKEYAASRNDEDGVLVLSEFTGSARQLDDALLVNPYDIEACAETLREALEMPREARQARMRRLRENVAEHDVYRWASDIFSDLSKIEQRLAA
ncbi:MAG: trehalose-6-phosphate synthase [Nitrospiria bacterium]